MSNKSGRIENDKIKLVSKVPIKRPITLGIYSIIRINNI